jgi:hypothetical protein
LGNWILACSLPFLCNCVADFKQSVYLFCYCCIGFNSGKNALEMLKMNAPNKQDNVLIEYECALIKNRLDGTPVAPIFVAEKNQKDEYKPVNLRMQFLDVKHYRSQSGTGTVSFLRFVSDVKMI